MALLRFTKKQGCVRLICHMRDSWLPADWWLRKQSALASRYPPFTGISLTAVLKSGTNGFTSHQFAEGGLWKLSFMAVLRFGWVSADDTNVSFEARDLAGREAQWPDEAALSGGGWAAWPRDLWGAVGRSWDCRRVELINGGSMGEAGVLRVVPRLPQRSNRRGDNTVFKIWST